jgi:alcohol dehydrogenase
VPPPGRARALVLEAPHRLVPRDLELPEVGEADGLLRVEACGLCGTDHEQFTGPLFPGFAFVPGHEVVGTVEAAGPVALERWGVRVGQRVAVEVFQSCRTCEHCRRGKYRRCRRHGMADMIGFVPVERLPGLWGGYATHLHLPPDALLLPVPEGLDPVAATLFNPLGAGIRWGRTLPGTTAGDVVAVLGPGIRGLASLVAAKEAGAGFILVTGRGAGDGPRLEAALRLGADATVDVRTEDPVAVLRRLAGRLADVVVDVTAKAPAALGQAVALARPGGTVVLAGTRGSDETPGFSPDAVVYKELHLVGALGVDAPAYREALAVLSSPGHPFADVTRRTVSLDGVGALLADMAGEGAAPPPLHGVVVPGS